MQVFDVWESYPTKDGKRWVVVLDDPRRTTYTFDRDKTPKFIVTSEDYAFTSFREELPEEDSLLAQIMKVWKVLDRAVDNW